jgi:hypothetical protein
MVNSVKESGGGLALQVTREARAASFVDEDADGDATRLAGVYVYGFDDVLAVFDAEHVGAKDRAEIVASAAQDTGSIHRGETASVEIAGNGYQVQLPGCRTAGFREGDEGHVVTASGLLVVHDGRQGRLANDLATLRREQQRAD